MNEWATKMTERWKEKKKMPKYLKLMKKMFK